jgi:hypothetical protein
MRAGLAGVQGLGGRRSCHLRPLAREEHCVVTIERARLRVVLTRRSDCRYHRLRPACQQPSPRAPTAAPPAARRIGSRRGTHCRYCGHTSSGHIALTTSIGEGAVRNAAHASGPRLTSHFHDSSAAYQSHRNLPLTATTTTAASAISIFRFTSPRHATQVSHQVTANMGVQPPPKKKDRASKISDLEKNLRNMQMQLDELRRGVEADNEHDEHCVPRGQRGRRSSKPQHGARGRHVPHPEDDDDEEIPVKLEKQLAAQPASDGSEKLTGRKRKQDVDVSGPDESFSGDLIRPVNKRAEREADRVAVQPAAAKRARLYCDL